MLGYNEMLSRIKPSKIICYGNPFDEMKGDIIEVDYSETNNLSKGHYIKKIYGCVVKGGGSASGQGSGNPEPTWEPKTEEAKRFLGKPGEIKKSYISTKKGGYLVETKIGEDGRATKERQYTDDGNPKKHSNPHDNTIRWNEKGEPKWGEQINYHGKDAPKFKYFKITGEQKMNNNYNGNFKSVNEFVNSVERNSEIVFEWNDKAYEICSLDGKKWWLCDIECDNENVFDKIESLINYKIGDEKLIDICTKFTVIERTF